MAEPKYYIGPMGNLYYRSGKDFYLFPLEAEDETQNYMEANEDQPGKFDPVLCLRPKGKEKSKEALDAPQGATVDGSDDTGEKLATTTNACTEANANRPTKDATETWASSPSITKFPDGPWIRHADEINLEFKFTAKDTIRDDRTVEEYRDLYKQHVAHMKANREGIKVLHYATAVSAVDMKAAEVQDEELLELKTERWFVNSPTYLHPGGVLPPSMTGRYGPDWRWNARGVYYRHYYSPEWVTAGRSLWIPTLDGLNWDDPTEENRRTRACTFLKHALDNKRWTKSEYAWEADAWGDVFGQIRDDPVIACDKHEYYTMRTTVHRVSCLQTGKSEFVTRIPDATFGLATFRPKHYQSAVASYELDAERLQALALHRNCGLRADPRWGEANLVFPFAVYEAKGWKEDPREARHQSCSAAAEYLDLLDALARRPGLSGKPGGATYQMPESRSSQVFALTSFGAHWHVMVGYRRPRLAREYKGRLGMSDTVYLFQRLWSGAVSTERSAWELLSIIDQIHEWGATAHRDFVIRHLRAWHEFGERCYRHDAGIMHFRLLRHPELRAMLDDGGNQAPVLCVDSPAWMQHLSDKAQAELKRVSELLMLDAYRRYFRAEPVPEPKPGDDERGKGKSEGDQIGKITACLFEACSDPGYPLSSPEEALVHFAECHPGIIARARDEDLRRFVYESFSDEAAEIRPVPLDEPSDKGREDEGGTSADVPVSVPSAVSARSLPRKRGLQGVTGDGDLGPRSKKRTQL